MHERLAQLQDEYRALESRLADGNLADDQVRYQETVQKFKWLQPIVASHDALLGVIDDRAAAKELLEMADEADAEELLSLIHI